MNFKRLFTLLILLACCHTLVYSQKEKKTRTQKSATEAKYEKLTSKYEFSGPFCDGLARVRLNKKWGFIDTTGAVIIPIRYNEVENFSDGIARVRIGQRWGLMEKTGREIIKPTFQEIGPYMNGKAKVLLDGTEYYMNKDGIRVDGP